MVGARIKPMFEEEARARQSLAGGDRKSVSADLREPIQGKSKSSEQAAEAVNVSPRSVESASRVIERGVPELANAVLSGTASVSAAAEIRDGMAAGRDVANILGDCRAIEPDPDILDGEERRATLEQIGT